MFERTHRTGDQPRSLPATPPDANGVITTTMIADADLAGRLARGALFSRANTVALIVGTPLVVILTSAGFALQRSDGIVVTAVTAAACAAIVCAVVLAVARARSTSAMRRIIPPGTEIGAEFGYGWIGHRLAGNHSRISLDFVDKVRVTDDIVMLTRGRRPIVLLPRELVPQPIVDEYLRRFGRA